MDFWSRKTKYLQCLAQWKSHHDAIYHTSFSFKSHTHVVTIFQLTPFLLRVAMKLSIAPHINTIVVAPPPQTTHIARPAPSPFHYNRSKDPFGCNRTNALCALVNFLDLSLQLNSTTNRIRTHYTMYRTFITVEKLKDSKIKYSERCISEHYLA